jgi:iron complex transport system substrate-binding protein
MAACRTIGTILEPARRIVSLAPSLTENLFFLGLGSRVVGVTEQCDLAEAAEVERIGSFSTPDITRIRELGTDLVLGLDRFHNRVAGELAEVGVPAILFNYVTVEDIFVGMEEIARAADAVEAVAPLTLGLRNRVSQVSSAAAGRDSPRVFRLLTDDPIVTPANACFQTDAIRLAGGTTMDLDFFEQAYVTVTLEEILDFDPQVIFSCGVDEGQVPRERCRGCRAVTPPCRRDVGELARRAGWSSTSAAMHGYVKAISCNLLCRPGPGTVEAIEWMAEVFSQSTQAPVAPQGEGR